MTQNRIDRGIIYRMLRRLYLAIFARQHRLARRRRRLHLCPTCGYDLRATAQR